MKFDLYKALNEYKPKDSNELENLEKIKKFLKDNDNCFSRTNLKGHITAGALVIDKDCNILLNHHKILNIWIHFGGHSDGDMDSLNVAKREVMEESGIEDIYDMDGKIFDIDVHVIPENKSKDEPEHYHYDIRFLFIAKEKNFKVSNESNALRWVSMQEAKELITNPATIRMIEKAYSIYKDSIQER